MGSPNLPPGGAPTHLAGRWRRTLGGRRAMAIAVAALALVVTAPAAAAPVFVSVGSVAPDGAHDNGGCTPCSSFPGATAAAPSYAFPFDGVLTRFSVLTGSSLANVTGEWVKARTFRTLNATQAAVESESAQGNLTTPSTIMTFWGQHVPASAGDLLGAQFHTGAFIDETPDRYTTAAAGDTAARDPSDPGPAVGGTATGTAFPNLRVNIAARLEHDDDHDGYGDGSQDLCLGDAAHSTTACTGSLFGGSLQGEYRRVGFDCTFACARVQLTSGGASTSPASDGVVVRWRLQAPNAGVYHIAILEPTGGGAYKFARKSDTVTITADEALWRFPTRLPIPAGGYVALVPPTFTVQTSLVTSPAGSTYTTVNDTPTGASTTLGSSFPGALLYDADIEPDADHDSYGDRTQDACPSDPTTHGLCPVRVLPPAGAGAIPGQVTSFKVRYRRFRVDRTGPVAATP